MTLQEKITREKIGRTTKNRALAQCIEIIQSRGLLNQQLLVSISINKLFNHTFK